MFAARRIRFVFLLVPLLLPACQRLDLDETLTLDAGDVKRLGIDAPRSEQHVTLTVNASPAPVDVYVVLEQDLQEAEDSLLKNKKPANSLLSEKKVQADTLQVTIPAKKKFAVLLAGATKRTQVQIKIVGK